MKCDPQVLVHLNAQLKNELTATNQYFLHYRMLKHWGFDKLAKKEYEESIGENVPEVLSCDLQSESGAQATIKTAIAYCESAHDFVSREILRAILDDTEEHIDWLETQIDLLAKVGLENYLQSQMGVAD